MQTLSIIHHQHSCELINLKVFLFRNYFTLFLFGFSIYVVNKVMKWIKKNGGIPAMAENSRKKSQLVYQTIDDSNGFYTCPLERKYSSRMNVVFRLRDGDEALEKEFLKGAEARGMLQLKGHRSVGGIRASLYNAVTLQDTETLVNYMKEFQSQH